MTPGAAAVDAPLDDGGWLLRSLQGRRFTALSFGASANVLRAGAEGLAELDVVELPVNGVAAERYDAQPGTVVLLRPDQHVCARWRQATSADIAASLRRALALP